MRKRRSVPLRELLATVSLSGVAVVSLAFGGGRAAAADLSVEVQERATVRACPDPQEIVILYDQHGRPTVPGRTEYYYCVTGTVLRPGDIPPPPEYCCR